MKKNFLSLGLIAAAAFTLTNCTQEIANPVEPSAEGTPFEIVASPAETKTTNDGMATIWAAGDALNLFHEYAGSEEYVSDGEFKFTAGDVFKGTLAEELDEESVYNWYAIYPYSSYYTTPTGEKNYMAVGSKKGSSQTQKGNDSMEHIAGVNYPLAGVAEDLNGGEIVNINMTHLTSLLEVVVNNQTGTELVVESVSFTGTEPIVGTFYINIIAAKAPEFTPSDDTYVDNTANLTVTDADPIGNGQSAKFYLAVKPFEAPAGSTLTLYVNGAAKEVTLDKAVKFEAGKIKTLNYTIEEEVAGPEVLTVEEFLDKAESSAVWYQLTGTIRNLVNATYGNFDLVDETGSVYVYGLTATQVASNDKSFASLGLKEGDVVTLMGTRASFNSTSQVGGPAYYVSHIVSANSPVITCTENVVAIKAGDGAKIYYTTNGDEPTAAANLYSGSFEISNTTTVKAIAVEEGKAVSLVTTEICMYVDPDLGGLPSGTVLLSEDFASLNSWSTTTASTLKTGSLTWTSAGGSMYSQVGCIKFGKSSAAANTGVKFPLLSSLSSPTNVVLTFKAVSSDSGYKLNVTATGGATVGTLSPGTITKNGTAINSGKDSATALATAFSQSTAQFSVNIQNVTSSTQIAIIADGTAKRWYLDDVQIVVL